MEVRLKHLKKYPKLYAKAVSYAVADEDEFFQTEGDHTAIQCAFAWNQTEEGVEFWRELYLERWDDAKNMHPELFETESVKPRKDDRGLQADPKTVRNSIDDATPEEWDVASRAFNKSLAEIIGDSMYQVKKAMAVPEEILGEDKDSPWHPDTDWAAILDDLEDYEDLYPIPNGLLKDAADRLDKEGFEPEVHAPSAPSRKKVEYHQEIIMDNTINRLNELGGEGWVLVAKEGITFIFAREVIEEGS
jgi:hypothetical protein